MAFNASVNLGTVGNGILGQTVSISGCTGASCTDCLPLASTQAVSSFPKTITGIPNGTVSLFVKVDTGDCAGTTQCISITGIPGATPTPTSTSTPTSTPTSTSTSSVGSTPTPTNTPTITPTITPTSTITPNCVTYVAFEVDTAGDVRYVDCCGNTTYLTFGIGPQAINDCIQYGSLFGVGASISFVTYGSTTCGCAPPTETPTPTSTPVYTFYRAAEILDSYESTTYCNNFGSGGQGFVMSQPFYTTDEALTPGSAVIYSDPSLTTLDTGTWVAFSNITRMAYITSLEYQSAAYRTTTDPDGDGTFSGGQYKYMRVDSNGVVQSTGVDSCSGGSAEN